MKVALVSLDPKWEDKPYNYLLCKQKISIALENSCQLIIFPEMTLTGFSTSIDSITENQDDSRSIQFFQDLAKKGIFIIFGIALMREERATNNLIVVSPNGAILANYAKIHPFSFSGEDDHYDGGTKLGMASLESIQFGLTICYDLRFPELYQALSKTASVIVNIANWPKARINHWHVLIRARAIENQAYMIGVNRVGLDGNGLSYVESSLVVDPEGKEVLLTRIDENVDTFELDSARVELVRKEFPVKVDRKVEFYKQIL
jgi:omega-amidase